MERHVQNDASTTSAPRRVSILGATGSIGASTLDLISANPESYDIQAITANTNAVDLARLAVAHRAKFAVIADEAKYHELRALLAGHDTRTAAGSTALCEAAAMPADCVVAGIVGAAGLAPTLTAVECGARVALANKECLVAAGRLFTDAVKANGSTLIPVDSEHSAVFQVLNGDDIAAIETVTLTASGGPFRTWSKERLARATPAEAVRHPKWSMGQKISVDSATLMNKGLELIEAKYLFALEPAKLDVLVHPQSIVHCLVAYCDGAVVAQMAMPDMRIPLSVGLAWPMRIPTATERLDLAQLGALTFEKPDYDRFPALGVAREAMIEGGAAPAVLNASNEIAVEAFLDAKIGFLDIATIVAKSLDRARAKQLMAAPATLADVFAIDSEARMMARDLIY